MPRALTRDERFAIAKVRGFVVSPEDEWLLGEFTWRYSSYAKRYPITRIEGLPNVFLHHFITGFPIWQGDVVDHINRDVRDNRRENLRIVSHATNMKNREKDDDTGIQRAASGNYKVYLHVGTYDTYEEAQNVRDETMKLIKHIRYRSVQ